MNKKRQNVGRVTITWENRPISSSRIKFQQKRGGGCVNETDFKQRGNKGIWGWEIVCPKASYNINNKAIFNKNTLKGNKSFFCGGGGCSNKCFLWYMVWHLEIQKIKGRRSREQGVLRSKVTDIITHLPPIHLPSSQLHSIPDPNWPQDYIILLLPFSVWPSLPQHPTRGS